MKLVITEVYKAATRYDMCQDDIFSCPALLGIFKHWLVLSCGISQLLYLCPPPCRNRSQKRVFDANGENIVDRRNQHRRTGVSKERLDTLTLTDNASLEKKDDQDGKSMIFRNTCRT